MRFEATEADKNILHSIKIIAGNVVLGLLILGLIISISGYIIWAAQPPALTVVDAGPSESISMVGEHTMQIELTSEAADSIEKVVILTESGSVTDTHVLRSGERTFRLAVEHNGFGGAITGQYTIRYVGRDGNLVDRSVVKL